MRIRKLTGRSSQLIVPEPVKRTKNLAANFLCDNGAYVFGIDNNRQRGRKAFLKFRELHNAILGKAKGTPGQAIVNFVNQWDPESAWSNPIICEWRNELTVGNNLIFCLAGCQEYVHENQEVKELWEEYYSRAHDASAGQCMITGKETAIAQLHPSLKNIKGAHASGASLVSYNANSYESFGKKQSFNSPMGTKTVFAYSTALSYILSQPRKKVVFGKTTIVFWADSLQDDKYTDLIYNIINPQNKGLAWSEIEHSTKGLNQDVMVHILGFSPNVSRIAVRFYYCDRFENFLRKMRQYYSDLRIVRDYDNRLVDVSIRQILGEIVGPKAEDAKQNTALVTDVMNAVLRGTEYPVSLLNTVLLRIRNDRDNRDANIEKVNYVRAAIIKGFLTRRAGADRSSSLREVVTVELNEGASKTEYLLGRLFAVLEKVHRDSNPPGTPSIKDRYFVYACASPSAVFPILLIKYSHQISKSGYKHLMDKKMASILGGINKFPTHLTVEQQGIFILGYYHQRAQLYKSSGTEPGLEEAE